MIASEKLRQKIELYENDNEKMTLFLDKLTFVTNYHNETELDKLLEIELANKFKLSDGDFVKNPFQNNIMTFLEYYNNGRSKFLSHEEGEQIFKRLKQKMEILKTTGYTEFYLSTLERYNILFDNDFTFQLTDHTSGFLSERNQSIFLNLNTNSPLLGAIKMMQTIKTMQNSINFNNDDELNNKYCYRSNFIFTNTKDLFSSERLQSYIEESFDSIDGRRVLVLQCDEFNAKEIDDLSSKFSNINWYKMKKVIFITPSDFTDTILSSVLPSSPSTAAASNSTSASDMIMHILDENLNFENLTSQSQSNE